MKRFFNTRIIIILVAIVCLQYLDFRYLAEIGVANLFFSSGSSILIPVSIGLFSLLLNPFELFSLSIITAFPNWLGITLTYLISFVWAYILAFVLDKLFSVIFRKKNA